jgi:hypothetical protein
MLGKKVEHCALAKKNVINMKYFLKNVSDGPIIMIGSCGLLLLIPHLFAILVSVLWWGCKKVNN